MPSAPRISSSVLFDNRQPSNCSDVASGSTCDLHASVAVISAPSSSTSTHGDVKLAPMGDIYFAFSFSTQFAYLLTNEWGVNVSSNSYGTSTTDNDENMIAIRGNYRAADIYFTEFNRLFNHCYFRSVTEALQDHHDDTASLFLDETDSWQQKYAPGKLKRKRIDIFGDTFIPPDQQPTG